GVQPDDRPGHAAGRAEPLHRRPHRRRAHAADPDRAGADVRDADRDPGPDLLRSRNRALAAPAAGFLAVETSAMSSAVFYRNLNQPPRRIVRGEGVYLYDEDGRRYLDAVGGAAVVAIGHGVPEILNAVAGQAERIPYVYGATFTHPWQE